MTILYPEMTPIIQLDTAQVQKNLDLANARDLPDAVTPGLSPKKDEVVAIIGGGPSMKEPLTELDGQTLLHNLESSCDVIKVLAGSAHSHLSNGNLSRADIAVFNLPDSKTASYADHLKPPVAGMTYLLATQCDPRVFDAISEVGADIEVYHSCLDGVVHPEGKMRIGAGSTAPTAALAVMMAKGYTKFEFYGVDGGRKIENEEALACIERLESPGKDTYAYPYAEERIAEDTIIIQIGRAYYSTTRNYWEQQREMTKLIDAYGDNVSLTFHGEGRLSGALLNEPRPKNFEVYQLNQLSSAPPSVRAAPQIKGPIGSG